MENHNMYPDRPVGNFGYIPKRMFHPAAPELSNLPFNILIVEHLNEIETTVLYEPLFETSQKDGSRLVIRYEGKRQGKVFLSALASSDVATVAEMLRDVKDEIPRQIEISFDPTSGVWEATCTRDGKEWCYVRDKDWTKFFVQIYKMYQSEARA